MKKQLLALCLFAILPPALQATKQTPKIYPQSDMQKYDREIERLYHSLATEQNQTFTQRLEFISRQFLGKPYFLGALGEGSQGSYDQHPLYRTEAFDCTTYVSTVLALSFAPNLNAFKQMIKKVRYKDAHVDFTQRNHFMTVDWNINNAKQGFIRDITAGIKDKQGNSIALTAEATIDKPNWYKQLPGKQLYLTNMTATEERLRLQQLHQAGDHQDVVTGKIHYLPLNKLFDPKGKPNPFMFAQIPNGAIIEIVRPNWNLKKKIGTNLNVSHLGFAFRNHQGLVFRQASLLKKKVSDSLLSDYLAHYLKSPTIKGINVQMIIQPETYPRDPMPRRYILNKITAQRPSSPLK